MSIPAELTLDFSGKQITRLVVNRQEQDIKVQDGAVFLDITKLSVGGNIVGIHYTNDYNNDGSGCVSFIDVDTKQYIYTQF